MTASMNSPRGELQALANRFVNQTFYGTLLRNLRESSQGTVMDSGPGSMTFIRQLDQELIKRISERGDSPVAAALVRKLGRSATLQEGSPAQTSLPEGLQTVTASLEGLQAETASLKVLEAAHQGGWGLLMGGRGDE